MDEQEDNLNQIMEYCLDNDQQLTFIEKLRFRNTVYMAGDDVLLRQGGRDRQPVGKIIAIARTAKIQFPVLLVAWYFSREDPIIMEQEFTHLGKRELIFSQYEDWQYVEALQAKIKVVDAETYRYLDPRDKEDDKLYYCRTYIAPNAPHLIHELPAGLCSCLSPNNPEQPLSTCLLCGLRFHCSCSGSDEVCLCCQ